MYRFFLKKLFFLLPPETAHYFVFYFLKILFRIPFVPFLVERLTKVSNKKLQRNLFGLTFENPIGLAAGFDKNAMFVDELAIMGFGFVEVGTVTPLPQPGNQKPRLFRLPKDEALLNRMGFNNDGADRIAGRLRKRKSKIIVGANIGKNKNTPIENAVSDYEFCFEKLFDVVDYFAINVSSPNTPGLRSLQEKEPLSNLLFHLVKLNLKKKNPKPVLLKIAPDLTHSQLDDIIEIVLATGIQGLIATNTTISREGLITPPELLNSLGPGGISGKPLRDRSTGIISYIHSKSQGKIPIIGAGGIHSPADALEKMNAGASLLQIYSGWVYSGPSLIGKICRSLMKS